MMPPLGSSAHAGAARHQAHVAGSSPRHTGVFVGRWPVNTRPRLSRAAIPDGRPALGLSLEPGHGGGGPGGPGYGGGRGGGGGGWGNGWGASEVAMVADADKKAKKNSKPIVLTLASFAVTKMAYVKITKMFNKWYYEQTGRTVAWRLTFAGSGTQGAQLQGRWHGLGFHDRCTQSRAVIDGLPADIVALALALDIDKIADEGLIREDWRSRFPNNSVVSESVIAIVTRKGNPMGIEDWGDLARKDVFSVCANPKTAGGARWNFLALWGHKMAQGAAAAEAFVKDVFMQVVVQPRDSREASDAFYKQGVGDCLLTYENEVIATNWMLGRSERTRSKILPYVVPQNNIRVENPVAIVDKVVDDRGPEVRHAAEAFVRFLYTDEAQREFAKWGFRSVTPSILKDQIREGLPPVKNLWSVGSKLGGWKAAQDALFARGKVLDRVQQEVGEARLEMQRSGVGLDRKKT